MNVNIKIDNKYIMNSDWFNKGIYYGNDILNEVGKFLFLEQLKQKFGISGDVMKYNSYFSI